MYSGTSRRKIRQYRSSVRRSGYLPADGRLINEYMPNLKKILDDSENYWSEITAPDGHTYGFPYIEEMYGLVLTGGPLLINKTWWMR